MYSAIVGGMILLIVFIILAMAVRYPCSGPSYILALATLVTAITGLVTALRYLM